MNILVTIAARGGSKGVKNKNIRPLCGTPLIALTIKQALAWGKASHVVVTTDSDEIARVAESFGAEVPFRRPAELATDTAAKVPALRHALQEMERRTGSRFDIIVDLDPTAPVRKPSDIDAALKLFLDKRPDTVLSVVHAHKSPYFNMLELSDGGFARMSKALDKPIVRRQDAPAVYSANASIYVYGREVLLNPEVNSALTGRTLVYVMDDLSGFDIDREVDFRFLEFLAKEKLVEL